MVAACASSHAMTGENTTDWRSEQSPSPAQHQVELSNVSSPSGEQEGRGQQQAATTVFFARCPPVTTEEQVRKLFSQFGLIEEVNLYRRWQSAKTSKGCGFVRFSTHTAAAAALQALNGKHMFENSEAPMVVEWLDPARLANRHQVNGDKHSSSRGRKMHTDVSASRSAAARARQLSSKLPNINLMCGHLSEHSCMSFPQVSPFSSSENYFTDNHEAVSWGLPGPVGCPPVHVVPMVSQSKAVPPILPPAYGSQKPQCPGSWVSLPTAVGVGSGPISVLPSTDSSCFQSQNLLQQLAEAASMPGQPSMMRVAGHDISGSPFATLYGQFRSAAAGSSVAGASNRVPLCNTSTPVMNLEELERLSGCLSMQPLEYSGQLSGLCAADLDPGSAALRTASSVMEPMYTGASPGGMTYLGEFSHPLHTNTSRANGAASLSSWDRLAVLSGQQLQQAAVSPAGPTAASFPNAVLGGLLQPLTGASSSGISQYNSGFGSMGAGSVCPTVPAGSTTAQGANGLFAQGHAVCGQNALNMLNIAPNAASDIINQMESIRWNC